MKSYKIFLKIAPFSIILFLSIGIYLKFTNQETGGFTYSRTGNTGTLSLNGNNIIFIGVIIFIFWFLCFVTRRKDKNELWISNDENYIKAERLKEKVEREKKRRENKRKEKKHKKNKH